MESVALILHGNVLKFIQNILDSSSKESEESQEIRLDYDPSCIYLQKDLCFIGTFDSHLKILDVSSLDCILSLDLRIPNIESNIPNCIHSIDDLGLFIGFRNGNLGALSFTFLNSKRIVL